MRDEHTADLAHSVKLTDDEAITLRRVAFGESDIRSLRHADLERLTRLRLVAASGSTLMLTPSGRQQFDMLPRASFAARLRQEKP